MNTAWQLPPQALLEDDQALRDAVEHACRAACERGFDDDLVANSALPVETRAVRQLGTWRVLLLLSPWMFVRLLLPTAAPPLKVPALWSAREREGADPVVLGPLIEFTLADSPQRAHLNYHPQLGHYLVQPLVLAMAEFNSAEEVYEAWNKVIRTRDENMRRMQRECPMQQEISRREFFSGLWQRGA